MLAVKMVLSAILFFGLFLLWMNAANYYDVTCVVIVTLPMILLIRWLDDFARDTIIIIRDDNTLLASFITGTVLILMFLGAYLVYKYAFGGKDIFVNIFDFLEKFIPLQGIRDKFNIY
jgi:hypothetical protein